MEKARTDDTPHEPGLCRVCGAGTRFALVADRVTHDRCPRCATLQKRLTAEQYGRLEITHDPGFYLDSSDQDEIAGHLEIDDKMAFIDRFAAKLSQRRNFLDIGCGMGGYLLAAQRLGFDVVGVEPSETHARVARELLQLPVVPGYFTPAVVEGKSFDLIMLSHVIEHIYDPKPFLDGILTVLNPGGVLAVITPNAESMIARVLGRRWSMLEPVDHVTLLGPAAARWLFDSGVECVVETSEYPYEFAATALGALRRRVAGGRPGESLAAAETVSGNEQPALLQRTGAKIALVKLTLSAASLPFYLWSKARKRGACLIMTITKPVSPAAAR